MSRITTAILGAVAALTLASCSPGGLPSPEPAGPAATTVPAQGTPEITPRPTEVPGPPVASLRGGATGPVAGELGTFFWGGLGSDSPWVVPTTGLRVGPGATLALTLDPRIPQERWTAAWAPVRGGSAGTVGPVAEGNRGPVEVIAPGQPGSWGLLVELHFPGAQRAAWYWNVIVGP